MGAQLEQGTPGGRTTKLGVWGVMAGVSYVSLMLPSFHGAVIPGNGHCGPCSRALSGALCGPSGAFLLRGVAQYGELHLGQQRASMTWRGTHVWPHFWQV